MAVGKEWKTQKAIWEERGSYPCHVTMMMPIFSVRTFTFVLLFPECLSLGLVFSLIWHIFFRSCKLFLQLLSVILEVKDGCYDTFLYCTTHAIDSHSIVASSSILDTKNKSNCSWYPPVIPSSLVDSPEVFLRYLLAFRISRIVYERSLSFDYHHLFLQRSWLFSWLEIIIQDHKQWGMMMRCHSRHSKRKQPQENFLFRHVCLTGNDIIRQALHSRDSVNNKSCVQLKNKHNKDRRDHQPKVRDGKHQHHERNFHFDLVFSNVIVKWGYLVPRRRSRQQTVCFDVSLSSRQGLSLQTSWLKESASISCIPSWIGSHHETWETLH